MDMAIVDEVGTILHYPLLSEAVEKLVCCNESATRVMFPECKGLKVPSCKMIFFVIFPWQWKELLFCGT